MMSALEFEHIYGTIGNLDLEIEHVWEQALTVRDFITAAAITFT